MKVLLGIHRLFPDLLSQNIGSIFRKALKENERKLCENLTFLALLDPEKYASGIVGVCDFGFDNKVWMRNLISEIRAYPHWIDTDHTYAVETFSKLLWLLRRSSPWGLGIEKLRSMLQTFTLHPETIRIEYKAFEIDGIGQVLHLVNHLKSIEVRKPAGLWSSIISKNGEAEGIMGKIEKIKTFMDEHIYANSIKNTDDLIMGVEELDECGKILKKCLETVFTNPIDVKIKLMDLISERWPHSKIDIRVKVDADQPGILASLEDLINSLNYVIDNANECILEDIGEGSCDETYWLEIEFCGYTVDGLASVMRIKDNLPWKEGIIPTGGMKQFAEYCRKHSAICEFNPEQEEEKVKIKVTFRIDTERTNNDYR